MTRNFHAVLNKFITLVVIATGQNLSIFLVFTATFLLCSQLNPVRAAAKMSAGGVGSPIQPILPVSYPSSSTNYCSEGI